MPLAGHFGRHWPEVASSRPMAHAEWLTARGFRVYVFRPPRRDDPDYEKVTPARGLPAARITWESPGRELPAWTEGHGRDEDDAIAMAYGRYALYRERKGQEGGEKVSEEGHVSHDYTSTACYHENLAGGDPGLHAACRKTCKFCGASCGCPRHALGEPAAGAPASWVDQARDIARELLRHGSIPLDIQRRIAGDPDLFWLRGEERPPGAWRKP